MSVAFWVVLSAGVAVALGAAPVDVLLPAGALKPDAPATSSVAGGDSGGSSVGQAS